MAYGFTPVLWRDSHFVMSGSAPFDAGDLSHNAEGISPAGIVEAIDASAKRSCWGGSALEVGAWDRFVLDRGFSIFVSL